jgi:hypothetical protein
LEMKNVNKSNKKQTEKKNFRYGRQS